MKDKILISVVIPCRNEARFIEGCLKSVFSFEIPDACKTEVIVVDGMSEDGTREILARIASENHLLKVVDNPGLIQSCAMNTALQHANGDYIMRLDAHSDYPADYLALLFETAERTGADNTGGLVITQPYDASYDASLVQALTTHRFGVGNSGFRTGMKEGPSDTVPYGFFRRQVFERSGKFDERLIRAQDYEFNRRILRDGGKIWLNPAIQLNYYNQPGIIPFLKKQMFREAPYNAYMWYVAPWTFAYRHAITAVFTGGLLAGIAASFLWSPLFWITFSVMSLYGLLALISSVQQAVRYRKPLHLLLLPFCFFLYHFLHGAGVIMGLLLLLLHQSPIHRKYEK
jgi:glycosyltransferase involved in cell wall biosynthesis